jgi:hypothetical protein
MIVKTTTKTTTTDNQGKIYKKVFSNFEQGAIVCEKGENKKYSVKPNISIRKGDGLFGEEVVLQMIIKDFVETYKAGTQTDHIETYFKINGETIEFFEEILKLLKEEVIKNE